MSNLIILGCGGGSRDEGKICQKPGATVSGTATFENRQVGLPSGRFKGGFTGVRSLRPIQFVDVEVVQDSNGDVIAWGTTDSEGFFCVDFGPYQGSVYVRVMAKTNHPDYNLQVKDPVHFDRPIHSIRSNSFSEENFGDTRKNLNATVELGVAGAFKILESLQKAEKFANKLTGSVPPLFTALYRYETELNIESGYIGFSMEDGSHAIIINGRGSSNDPDEYDESIVWHEFSHFLIDIYAKDSSKGGPHYFLDNTQDIRLSFSEGWATFFSGAIKGDRYFLDVVGGDPSESDNGIRIIDLEDTPVDVKAYEVYTTNELAVAKVLWDIFDGGTNEPFDRLNAGIKPMWDVVANYLPSVKVVSMDSFWEKWFEADYNSLLEMENLTKEFKMEFYEDQFEDDNSPDPLRKFEGPLPEGPHTLYPYLDVDYIAFDAQIGQSYTIQTGALKNGADTYLEILDADMKNILAFNDNHDLESYSSACGYSVVTGSSDCPVNDSLTLSSKISNFIAPSNGTFYAKISRSPDAPPSAGLFGSYEFSVASP